MHNFIWILIKICLQVLLGLGGGIHSTECHSSFLVQTNWSCLSLSPVGLHHCLDLSLLFAHLFILYHFISFFVDFILFNFITTTKIITCGARWKGTFPLFHSVSVEIASIQPKYPENVAAHSPVQLLPEQPRGCFSHRSMYTAHGNTLAAGEVILLSHWDPTKD